MIGYKPSPGNRKSGNESQVVREVCHLTGDTKEKCYCIHGYPSWHKFFGKPIIKPNFYNARVMKTAQVSSNDQLKMDSGKKYLLVTLCQLLPRKHVVFQNFNTNS